MGPRSSLFLISCGWDGRSCPDGGRHRSTVIAETIASPLDGGRHQKTALAETAILAPMGEGMPLQLSSKGYSRNGHFRPRWGRKTAVDSCSGPALAEFQTAVAETVAPALMAGDTARQLAEMPPLDGGEVLLSQPNPLPHWEDQTSYSPEGLWPEALQSLKTRTDRSEPFCRRRLEHIGPIEHPGSPLAKTLTPERQTPTTHSSLLLMA